MRLRSAFLAIATTIASLSALTVPAAAIQIDPALHTTGLAPVEAVRYHGRADPYWSPVYPRHSRRYEYYARRGYRSPEYRYYTRRYQPYYYAPQYEYYRAPRYEYYSGPRYGY